MGGPCERLSKDAVTAHAGPWMTATRVGNPWPPGSPVATFARQSAIKGQPFEQSGMSGRSLGQHGISSMAIPAMSSMASSGIAMA